MNVDMSKFKEAQSYTKEINKANLNDIEIEGIEILDSVRKDWSCIGRNNMHFVEFLVEMSEKGVNPVKDLWEEEE